MEFWQVKVKYINYERSNDDFDEIVEEELFYEDIEQAMAAILDMQNESNIDIKITDISIKRRSVGTCRIEYTLNKREE